MALPRDRSVLADEEAQLREAGIPSVRIGTRRPPGSLASQIFGQVSLPWLAWRLRPEVVFVPREVAPLLLPRPVVVLSANLLCWRTLRELDPAAPDPGLRGRVVGRLRRIAAKAAARRAAAVVAPSRVVGDLIPPLAPVEVIPFGVDVEGIDAPREDRSGRPIRLLVLGNIGRHKRIDVIIDIAGELADSHGLSLVLDLWGRVPDADEIVVRDHLARRLGDRGRLRGFLDPARRREVFAEADVLIVGSGTESFGFPMLEAMRTSTLVLAPDAAIGREIGGGHVVLYPEGDAIGGARVLADLLQPHRAQEVSGLLAAARRRAESFTWERCVSETLDLLASVAEEAGPTRLGPPG